MSYRIASRPILPKSPRVRDKAHLGYIAQMPSVISGIRPVEVCHLRYSEVESGKPQTGMGRKPSDVWVLPLTPGEHRLENDSQHSGAERDYWNRHGIDPIPLCLALYAVSGNIDDMESLIRQARTLFPARAR